MEFLNKVSETFNERLRSPFLSSFVFSWLILKWEAIAVIFGGECVMTDRIFQVNTLYLKWDKDLFIPIGIALVYTIGFPWITSGFEYLTAKARVFSDKSKHGRRKNEMIFNRDTALITYQQKKYEAQMKDLEEKDVEIDELKNDIKLLTSASEESDLRYEEEMRNDDFLYGKLYGLWKHEHDEFRKHNNVTELWNFQTELMGKGLPLKKYHKDVYSQFESIGILSLDSDTDLIRYTPKGRFFIEEFSQDAIRHQKNQRK